MKPSAFRTVGVGGPLLDHIFGSPISDPVYVGTAGGGSTWNCLVNLAFRGYEAYAVGRVGDDSAGHLAIESMRRCGVDVAGLRPNRRIRTQIIYEQADLDLTTGKHRFLDRCLVCHARTAGGPPSVRLGLAEAEWPAGTKFICMDRISTAAQALASRARVGGLRPVLDLGHLSPLRYTPVATILGALRHFDVILMPARVARSIQKRAGLREVRDLVTTVGITVFCVSAGEHGAWLYTCRGRGSEAVFVPPASARPIDTSGAGDAFLALLLESLNCSREINDAFQLFAERAPQELGPVLTSIGARGHIPESGVTNNALEVYIKKPLSEIRDAIQGKPVCPFCEAQLVDREERQPRVVRPVKSARKNISILLKRALFAAEKAEAVGLCRTLLDSCGSAYVVGTGGSYPAAVFIADALNSREGLFAQPIKPLDYIKRSKHTDLLVVVSYSGRTSDCGAAIRHGQALGVGKVAIVTAAETPELGSMLRKQDIVISYARTDRERGFVSITGTVSPCALWAAAVCGTEAVAYLDQTIEMPWRDPRVLAPLKAALNDKEAIDAIGTGFATVALLDFESKLTEGNLGRVILHESKDFSHGRFSLIFRDNVPRTFIHFKTKASSRYEDKLSKTLQDFGQVVEFQSSKPDLLGGLELLVGAQFLAVALGECMGKDISCPGNISKSGLRLYRWRALP